jgi:hypothetical protein
MLGYFIAIAASAETTQKASIWAYKINCQIKTWCYCLQIAQALVSPE